MSKVMNRVYRFFFPVAEPDEQPEPQLNADELAQRLVQQVAHDQGIDLPLMSAPGVSGPVPVVEIKPGDEIPGVGPVPESPYGMGGIGVAVYIMRPEDDEIEADGYGN